MIFKKECPLNRKEGENIASFCECWRNANCIIHPTEYCYFVNKNRKKEKS